MYNGEYAEKLKKHHMCVKCKKQDAYTLNGRSLCYDCLEYYRKRGKIYTEQNRDKILSRNREKRLDCINNNICSRCLKRKTDGIFKLCSVCRTTQNAKRRAKTKYVPGLVCYHCKNPLNGQIKANGEQSKLCSHCYEKVVKLARENIKNKSNYERSYKNGN